MAEESAAKAEVAAPAPQGGGGAKPILYIVLLVLNMIVLGGVGYMLFQNKKKEAAEPKIEQVINAEAHKQHEEANTEKEFIGKVIPLETFVINLAGSKGRRIAKINMEIEIEGESVAEEIDKRKAQIRDIIIILLSSKTYEEVSARDGKESLRSEIKDTVNAFLTKGQIKMVYFTEFLYN